MAMLCCLQVRRKAAIGEHTLYRQAHAALRVDEKVRKDLPSQICALARLQQGFSTLMSCAVA